MISSHIPDLESDDPGPLHISCDTRGDARTSWIMSVVCASLAGYGAYQMSRGPLDWKRDGPILAIFLIVFPGIALLIVLGSIWTTFRWRRQGESTLEIPWPYGRSGQPLRGVIRSARHLPIVGPARVTLERLETRVTRHAGKTRTRTDCTWRASHEVAATLGSPPLRVSATTGPPTSAGGTVFPVQIEIPADVRAPGLASGGDGRVKWALTLEAPTLGVDYMVRFDIPAYAIQGDDDE